MVWFIIWWLEVHMTISSSDSAISLKKLRLFDLISILLLSWIEVGSSLWLRFLSFLTFLHIVFLIFADILNDPFVKFGFSLFLMNCF